VAAFSFAKTKYAWYVLPFYPAFGLLIGRLLADFLKGSSTYWVRVATAAACFMPLVWSSEAPDLPQIWGNFPMTEPAPWWQWLFEPLNLGGAWEAVGIAIAVAFGWAFVAVVKRSGGALPSRLPWLALVP